MKRNLFIWMFLLTLVTSLSACGGGSGGTAPESSSSTSKSSLASSNVSSGTISAFGSVFVNGHEFSTVGATVVNDDTGAVSNTTTGLEVGEVVDVIPSADSTNAHPVAQELHIHPLVRGYVDSSDMQTGDIVVMGQTVEISSATLFSDHRACVSATSNACTAITDQSGLTATTGTGSSAVAGTYVTINGYLLDSNSSSTGANIVATLVSVSDAPATTSTSIVNFKAEGVVTATATNSITIAGLKVDLASAKCYAMGLTTSCASAFSTGQVVSAFAAAAPSLPATNFTAAGTRLSAKIPGDVTGNTIEIAGVVSKLDTTANTFVVRGLTIDASGLPAGTTMPAVGDLVRVEGTIGKTDDTVVASNLKILRSAKTPSYLLRGDETNVAAGSTTDTYSMTLLGQTISVDASTYLADHSSADWEKQDPATNPFNITTFQTYLGNSASQHVVVTAHADANGNLVATAVIIVPASTVSSIAGLVDATPSPVNSATTGTPTTFSIHGVSVSADPASIEKPFSGMLKTPAGGTTTSVTTTTVAAGDRVIATGSFTAGNLTISAPPGPGNVVIDFGTLTTPEAPDIP